jgi:hypothetical protein
MSKTPTHNEALEKLDFITVDRNHSQMIEWCDTLYKKTGKILTDEEARSGLKSRFDIHTDWVISDWIQSTYVPVEGSPEVTED